MEQQSNFLTHLNKKLFFCSIFLIFMDSHEADFAIHLSSFKKSYY